jgi:hypothetical protein
MIANYSTNIKSQYVAFCYENIDIQKIRYTILVVHGQITFSNAISEGLFLLVGVK